MSSLSYPYVDILRDALRPFSNNSYLILTDHEIPIRIYPAAVDGAGIPDFQIHSTSKKTCKELGSTDSRMPQTPEGYMCHGYTEYPVKVPYVGQRIYFRIQSRKESVTTGHVVKRIYDREIAKLISDPWKHIMDIFDGLASSRKRIDPEKLFITIAGERKYNSFLRDLLLLATHEIHNGEMSLSNCDTNEAYRMADQRGVDIQDLFEACYISENRDGSILIADALYVLYMEAIHRARPMATEFDANGILQVSKI